MAHTPGPWVIIDGEIQPGIYGKGIFGTRGTMLEPIASIFHSFPEIAEGNANLMGNALLMFKALEAVEWIYGMNGHAIVPHCPCCLRLKSSGHKPDCKLAAALAAARS